MWETCWPTKVQTSTGYGHLGQSYRLCDPSLNSKVKRIKLCVRTEGDVNAVETKARLIHYIRAESTGFIQSKYLATRLPRVSEAWNRIALQCRLAALVTLKSVITVQPILAPEIVTNIPGPLIDIYRGCCGTTESGAPDIRVRNQRQQLFYHRISYGCSLCVGGHCNAGNR